MVEKKEQHFVPKSYLAAWSDPETPAKQTPYVHTFLKDGSGHKRKSPSNVFWMPDLYTRFAPNGERDLSIEDWLCGVEGRFVQARNHVLNGNNPDEDCIADIFLFVSTMITRIPRQIERFQTFWKRIETVASDITINPNAKPIPSLNRHEESISLSMEDVRKAANDPMGTWFPITVAQHAEAMAQFYGLTILVRDDYPPFLTNDNPAATYDVRSEERRHPFRGGLSSPDLQIVMPASPSMAFHFKHSDERFLGIKKIDGRQVNEINFRTIIKSQERFVSDRADLDFVCLMLEFIRRKSDTTFK